MIWTQSQLRNKAEALHKAINKADRELVVRYDLLKRKPIFWTARPDVKVTDASTIVGTYQRGVTIDELYHDMKATAEEWGEVA